MERVQFQQEQMLAELKDLVQKGLFTQKEIKQIMKKRTAFETALVRRVAKKNDFLRYATYEMGLEALRRKRAERIKIPKGPPTISDYALVRRQFQIFERALKKFKSDTGLWIQYIQIAKKEGARSLVGRITARALQLFPNIPAFYILAASHELEHLSPSAARSLLQRGIRLNAESVEMWREYVKMELGFVESMRRRWNVLGINLDDKGKGKERQRDSLENDDVERMEVEAAEPEGDESEAARREILGGAIVKSVISSAAKALPKPELFISLHDVVSTYPSPQSLRSSLLDHLHTLLQTTLPHNAQAIKLTATRFLTADIEGAQLIDQLKKANEMLSNTIRDVISSGRTQTRDEREQLHSFAEVYAEFIDKWCRTELDPTLQAYLLGSLHSLIQHTIDSTIPLSPLLSTHLTLLTLFSGKRVQADLNDIDIPLLPSSSKILKLARKYTTLPSTRNGSRLWLARLETEKALLIPSSENSPGGENGDGAKRASGTREVEKTWKEARQNVSGEGVIDVLMWGVNAAATSENENLVQRQKQLLETLLTESLRMQDSPSWRTVHEKLLQYHTSLVIDSTVSKLTSEAVVQKNLLKYIQRIMLSYIPTSHVWESVFNKIASSISGSESNPILTSVTFYPVLRLVYTHWSSLDVSSSGLTYATWLLQNDRAKESVEIIKNTLQALEGGDKADLETRWKDVINKSSTVASDVEEEDVRMIVDGEGSL
ncbi:hypothetical protein QCA50_004605 [Cerrena zonata]|uniref:U3 small nucleolar RNA-associated protein 6 N-terminal domain-containing protein n=1 Tax=Cerrena zonata TaxID=2478898 RepID=A0AAW0GU70_9APHY